MIKYLLKINLILLSTQLIAQINDSTQLRAIYTYNLTQGSCYENLRSLCKDVGNRLSGSHSAQKAVEWAALLMEKTKLDTIYFQRIMVPHWVRGKTELVSWKNKKGSIVNVNCTALGGSVAVSYTHLTLPTILLV